MELNQRLFLLVLILCSWTELTNSSNSYSTISPINCLPPEIQEQLDAIAKKVELEPENGKITPNIISNCLEECNKKAEIAIIQMNQAFTIGFAIVLKSLNKIEETENIVVRFVPEIVSKCRKNKNSKKIDCHCSTTNLKMYGSKTSKSIWEKMIKDILSEKKNFLDINWLVDEIRKIPKLGNCMVEFKTVSSTKNSKSKDLKTTSVQKKSSPKTKLAVKLHRRDLTEREKQEIREAIVEIATFWILEASSLVGRGLGYVLIFLRCLLMLSLLFAYFFNKDLFRQTINSVVPGVFSGVPPFIWFLTLIFACIEHSLGVIALIVVRRHNRHRRN